MGLEHIDARPSAGVCGLACVGTFAAPRSILFLVYLPDFFTLANYRCGIFDSSYINYVPGQILFHYLKQDRTRRLLIMETSTTKLCNVFRCHQRRQTVDDNMTRRCENQNEIGSNFVDLVGLKPSNLPCSCARQASTYRTLR